MLQRYINGLFCLDPPPFLLLLLPVHPKVEQITTVFSAATRQKAWDHFSKAQRKNIDIWRKQCEVGKPSSVLSSLPGALLFFSAVISESAGELTDSPAGSVVFAALVVVVFLDASPSQTDRPTPASDLFLPAAEM